MLESQAVEWLFARLHARYGTAWLAKFDGVPAQALKADWGRELEGLSRPAVGYGLRNLPPDSPPNAAQFRALCIERPDPQTPQLEAPKPTDEERAKSAEIRRATMEVIAKNVGQGKDRKWVQAKIAEFRTRINAGERLSFAQRDWLRHVAHLEYGSDELPGDFHPIPVEALPVAMRPDAHTVAPDGGEAP